MKAKNMETNLRDLPCWRRRLWIASPVRSAQIGSNSPMALPQRGRISNKNGL